MLDRSGTLNSGWTVPSRRYLRIVFRESPVRRAISRIESSSRNAHRRITLSNAMSITPLPPLLQLGDDRTWVTSQWKSLGSPGQLSAEINSQASSCLHSRRGPKPVQETISGRLSVGELTCVLERICQRDVLDTLSVSLASATNMRFKDADNLVMCTLGENVA